MSTLTANPPPTPVRGLPRLVAFTPSTSPLRVIREPAVFRPYDPPLTPGQKRVFEGERARLFRMLNDRRTGRIEAVLVILEDLAGQAPAVDAVIREEAARRSLPGGAARPRLSQVLTRRADS